jgi:hypothetical protein
MVSISSEMSTNDKLQEVCVCLFMSIVVKTVGGS